MSPYGEGFLAKWVPETAPQFGGGTVHLLIRVRCDGEPDDRLQRRLQIAPGAPGVIGVTSPRHQIEDWPGGEPPAGRGVSASVPPLRSGILWKNWTIPHRDDLQARLHMGLDTESHLFGFFARIQAPADGPPDLWIRARQGIIYRVSMRPLAGGFHALWAPEAPADLTGKNLLAQVILPSGEPSGQQRLAIIPGPPGILGVTSRRGIGDWPDALPPASITGTG